MYVYDVWCKLLSLCEKKFKINCMRYYFLSIKLIFFGCWWGNCRGKWHKFVTRICHSIPVIPHAIIKTSSMQYGTDKEPEMEFLYYSELAYWFVTLRIREWKMKGKIKVIYCFVWSSLEILIFEEKDQILIFEEKDH